MTDNNLTEKELYNFLQEQKEIIPVFSLLWEVNTSKNEKNINFNFFSKPHLSNEILPENFYKPTISIINLDEK